MRSHAHGSNSAFMSNARPSIPVLGLIPEPAPTSIPKSIIIGDFKHPFMLVMSDLNLEVHTYFMDISLTSS